MDLGSNEIALGTASGPDGDRRSWEPMRLEYVGHVGDVMHGHTGNKKDHGHVGKKRKKKHH